MSRITIAFAALCMLSTPSLAQQVIDDSGRSYPPADIKSLIEIMSHDARNPIAVQFRDIREATNPKFAGVYCGEVNLPNRIGGYDGFTSFWADTRENYSLVEDPTLNGGDEIFRTAAKEVGCIIK